jgi:hypothetical protein
VRYYDTEVMTYSPGMVCTHWCEYLIINSQNDIRTYNPLGILDRPTKLVSSWPTAIFRSLERSLCVGGIAWLKKRFLLPLHLPCLSRSKFRE